VDLNGDGNLDLAVTNENNDTLAVLLVNGDGTFGSASVTSITAVSPVYIAPGDFNGDGKPDLAIANYYASDPITVLLGNGDGTFTSTTSPGGSYAASIASADFNGDGIPDLAVPNSQTASLNVFLGNSTSTASATLAGVAVPGSGTHNVLASYPGDSYNSSSLSGTAPLTATQIATSSSLSASPSGSVTYGTTVQLTATVSPSTVGTLNASGTVSFYNGASLIGSASLSGGQAIVNASTLPAGSNSITATYAGDANFAGSTSSPIIVMVTKANPTLTWPTPAPISYGTPLSSAQLNATASVPGTFVYTPPSGTVLGVGSQTLSVLFTPTDTTDYNTATGSVILIVE